MGYEFSELRNILKSLGQKHIEIYAREITNPDKLTKYPEILEVDKRLSKNMDEPSKKELVGRVMLESIETRELLDFRKALEVLGHSEIRKVNDYLRLHFPDRRIEFISDERDRRAREKMEE